MKHAYSKHKASFEKQHSKAKGKMVLRILFALSATVLLVAQQPAAQPRTVELLLSKARALESRGRLDLAAQAWQQLLMVEPEQQDAIAGLARAAKARGNDQEATALVERLRKVNPANPAIQQVESLVRNERRNPQLQEAARLAQSGQPEKAVAAYRSAFGGNTPSADWAVAYYETLAGTPGGWEQATAGLQEALQKNPGAAELKLALGRLYSYRPNTRMKGIALLETSTGAYARSGQQAWRQALAWEGGSARSAESMRRYLAQYPDAALQASAKKGESALSADLLGGEDLRQAYNALKSEDLAQAEKLFNAALEKNSKSAGALAGIGFVRMKQEDFGGALVQFEAAAAHAPTNRVIRDATKEARFWNFIQQGAAALKDGRAEDAVYGFQKAMAERPNDKNAIEGLAGALMMKGEYSDAIPLLDRLVRADSTRERSWMDLVNAKYRSAGAQPALEAVRKIPPGAAAKLASSVEYLALLSNIYRTAGRTEEAVKTFAGAVALSDRTSDVPSYVQSNLASLYMEFGDPGKAARAYRKVVDADPANLDAWEGFLLASNRSNEATEALQKLQSLPASVHGAAQARASFLRAVATLQSSVGNLASAETLLAQAVTAETTKGSEVSFATELQSAQVWLELGKNAQAAAKFLELTRVHPNNPEPWKGLVLAHQKAGSFEQASEAVNRIPAAVAVQLETDPDYLSVLATIYKETKTPDEAAQMLQTAVARFVKAGRSAPPALTTQLAWILLEKPGSERDLFMLLRNARGRTDLSAEQRRSLDDVWSVWFRQSADKSIAAGDAERAVSILQAGIRLLPSDVRLQRSLATAYLTRGDAEQAVAAFKSAGLSGATAGDYAAAIGACIGAQETKLAEQWLRDGLTKFPANGELLTLAGKHAAAKGDFKKAEALWRLAVKGMDEQSHQRVVEGMRQGPEGIADLKAGNPADDAGALLLTTSVQRKSEAEKQATPTTYRLPWETQSVVSERQAPGINPGANNTKTLIDELLASRQVTPSAPKVSSPRLSSSMTPIVTGESTPKQTSSKDETNRLLSTLVNLDANKPVSSPSLSTATPTASATALASASAAEVLPDVLPQSVALLLDPKIAAPEVPERDRMLDRLKTLEGRNSPFVGLGGAVQSRNGQAGFERMTLQESVLESSNILSGRVRASVVAKSVFADAAGPDGESLLQFGMLPQGDTFEAPSANGFAAELQLSGNNYGLRVGSSPRGFLVQNVIGSFRVRPAGGPITLTFDRDSIKDTILSYAGARDPLTKRVWGGVIANTGVMAGNWGSQKSGVYFNLGFQHITGESVQTNRRIDGTMGTYWQLASTSGGSLKAGVNLFAMHYAKNLRFFTMGHGGYFSPQQFLLFNVPINWSGKAKRLEYVIGTSIGSQSFTEEASPYYPMDPLIQGTTGPYYPKMSSSGVNYNFDARTAYQVAENWFLIGFLNVNNARFYSQQTAGISIRYFFRPRPLETDLTVPSIPDWRGRQPFGIQ